MRAFYLGMVVLALLAASVAARPYETDRVTINGKAAGAKAGTAAATKAAIAAGREAGEEAARATIAAINKGQHATIAVTKPGQPAANTNEASQGITDVAKPLSHQEWAKLSKSNPGAVSFFRAFDKDSNNHWDKSEWDAGIKTMISRRYLPGKFAAKSDKTWAGLKKTANGQLTVRDFLAWSAKIPAHAPVNGHIATPKPAFGNVNLKTCEDAFSFYDEDHSQTLDLKEFRKAVQGRVADDAVLDRWYALDHLGQAGSMTPATWTQFCVALTGLPPGPQERRHISNPCRPNPCKEAHTICMRDPHVCQNGTATCQQYRCVRTSGVAKPNIYSKCIVTFEKFDTNKDKALDQAEFTAGVHKAQAAKQISSRVNAHVQWNHFDMTVSPTKIDVYQFVHFCIAVANDGADTGGTAKGECWDVFTTFDADKNQMLSHAEFTSGIRKAKANGHIPISMDTRKIWQILPKNKQESVPPGPFINWCLAVSTGVDPIMAAKSTLAPGPTSAYQGIVVTKPKPTHAPYQGGVAVKPTPTSAGAVSYQGAITHHSSNSTNSSKPSASIATAVIQAAQKAATAALNIKLTSKNKDVVVKAKSYCEQLFDQGKAGSSSEGLTMDQFHYMCRNIAPGSTCENYPVLFTKADKDQSGQLSVTEFSDVCQHGGKVTEKTITADQARKIAAMAGEEAGRVAGLVAGQSVGRDAGRKAAAGTIPFQFRELNIESSASSGMQDSDMDADGEEDSEDLVAEEDALDNNDELQDMFDHHRAPDDSVLEEANASGDEDIVA